MKPRQYCVICSHPNIAAINRAVTVEVKTPKQISDTYGVDKRTLYKHSRRCLELGILDALRERRINQAVSVYDELLENLQAAKEARTAAREWLDVDGKLDLDYRPSEILVAYEDYDDLTEQLKPRKKKATLQELLDIVSAKSNGSIRAAAGYAKRADLREYLLKAIDRVDTVIDKFARIQGEYQQERMNENDIDKIRRQIDLAATRFNTDFLTELQFFMETQAGRLRPDIRANLREKLLEGRGLLLPAGTATHPPA